MIDILNKNLQESILKIRLNEKCTSQQAIFCKAKK